MTHHSQSSFPYAVPASEILYLRLILGQRIVEKVKFLFLRRRPDWNTSVKQDM